VRVFRLRLPVWVLTAPEYRPARTISIHQRHCSFAKIPLPVKIRPLLEIAKSPDAYVLLERLVGMKRDRKSQVFISLLDRGQRFHRKLTRCQREQFEGPGYIGNCPLSRIRLGTGKHDDKIR